MDTLDFNNFLNNENIDKKGVYFKELKLCNIRKACRDNTPYKGLIFKFK